MKIVLQRVSSASVTVENQTVGEIQQGYLLLLGIEDADTEEDAEWLLKKIIQLRVFADDEGKMNLSLEDVNGELLVVSQFTLHAKYKKGNRPSFIHAANPTHAEKLYNYFINNAKISINQKVESGQFGAHMEINLCNDGPVTIIMDTKNKE